MLYLTCTMISRVDLAHDGVSRAKNWVPMDCCNNCTVTSRHIFKLRIVLLLESLLCFLRKTRLYHPFQLHRLAMIFVLTFVIIGFIAIFVEIGEYSQVM